MKKFLLLLLVSSSLALAAQTHHPDEHGEKLKQYYLSLNVENLWLPGHRVNWETGVTDTTDHKLNPKKTHCSAFAAATCKKLGIYILNPDEHKHLLANAQYDWLQTPEAAAKGWKPIAGETRYASAQDYANKGYVVVAVIQNPDPHQSGHTALITPATVTDEQLAETGPKLIMAGGKNRNYISLKAGFKNHLTSWPENQIEFYYYVKPVF